MTRFPYSFTLSIELLVIRRRWSGRLLFALESPGPLILSHLLEFLPLRGSQQRIDLPHALPRNPADSRSPHSRSKLRIPPHPRHPLIAARQNRLNRRLLLCRQTQPVSQHARLPPRIRPSPGIRRWRRQSIVLCRSCILFRRLLRLGRRSLRLCRSLCRRSRWRRTRRRLVLRPRAA